MGKLKTFDFLFTDICPIKVSIERECTSTNKRSFTNAIAFDDKNKWHLFERQQPHFPSKAFKKKNVSWVVDRNLVEHVHSEWLLCQDTCVNVKGNNYIHSLKSPWMCLKVKKNLSV